MIQIKILKMNFKLLPLLFFSNQPIFAQPVMDYCRCLGDSLHKVYCNSVIYLDETSLNKEVMIFKNVATPEKLHVVDDSPYVEKKYIMLSILSPSKKIEKYLANYPGLKSLEIGTRGKLEASAFKYVKDSLEYLSVYSPIISDQQLSFPKLKFFASDCSTTFPTFLSYSSDLKYLLIRIKKLQPDDLKTLPPDLICLNVGVEKFNFEYIPREVFNLNKIRHIALWVYKEELEVLPRLPEGIDENYNLEYLGVPIDLGDKDNVKALAKFPALEYLSVSDFTSSDYSIINNIMNLKELYIDNISDEKVREIKKNIRPGIVVRN
jgi:hypothetical protein